jgi:hypothetical protein
MSLPFNSFNVSPSCRTPNPTSYPQNFHPLGPCSHCSNPYHSLCDCLHWGKFFNFLHEQININFSNSESELNSNFNTPDWSNHFDFLWQAHATENFAQSYGLHYSEYPQSDNQFFDPSSYDYPLKQSSLEETFKEFMELIGQPTILTSQEPSLEDTLEAFRQTVNQPFHETKDAIVANTEAVTRLEGQFSHLVAEFNMIEEEEF